MGYNQRGKVLTSAARTATPADSMIRPKGGGGKLQVIISVTAITASPSVVFTIRGRSASGVAFDLLASAAITAVGVTVLQIGPGLPDTANVSANKLLPSEIVVHAEHGDADSITYSVDYEIIP